MITSQNPCAINTSSVGVCDWRFSTMCGDITDDWILAWKKGCMNEIGDSVYGEL